MEKGKQLTSEEIGKIMAYRDQGLSMEQISVKIGRSKCAICHLLKDPENYGKKKSPGRRKSLCPRDPSLVLRLARTQHLNSTQIQARIETTTSTSTIRRVLQQDQFMKFSKLKKKPKLELRHAKARLEFSERHIRNRTNWDKIIFSDEKKWNLDGPDGIHFYWHDLRDEKRVLSRRQQGGGSVMTWAGFAANGTLEMAFLEGKQDKYKYQDLLEVYLLPYGEDIAGPEWIFQQDNAPAHRANDTKRWLEDHGVRVLDWPAVSPDLNPIEDLRGIFVRRVYKKDGQPVQFQTREQLKRAITEEWSKIDGQLLRNLASSMYDSCMKVIKNGWHFD